MDETIKDFETALAELAGIVKKLEEGDRSSTRRSGRSTSAARAAAALLP
ncbi:MAG: hypothetical protein U0P30_11845 [Vicinamibacterales bacterium]